jgi:type IV secretory pathway TraG/TraD family ATPase VirD4
LQRIFLIAIMQMIERRDRSRARHVCLFLDEFKYLISRPALELLGAIRDKRAHAILAHQSLGDLRDCPADLDADSVVASVNENTAIKIAYAVRDPDTADWLARMSGQILVDDEIRQVKTNMGLAETRENGRSLRQAERPLIDTNMLQSLPDRCAVLFGVSLAQFFFTSPVRVRHCSEQPKPTSPPDVSAHHDTALPPPYTEPTKPRTIAAGVIDVD